MTKPDPNLNDPNEINVWLDTLTPVDFKIEGRVLKRCPVTDEEDVGMIEIYYTDATRLPELHEVARLLEHYDEAAITHENYTAMMCRLFDANKVVTTWSTAGLGVTCTAT